MPQITRKLEFDAGHRVLGHESKCAHLHGHRYVVEITVSSFGLDEISRVVDFGVVKGLVGQWLDENWDHNMLLHMDDPLLEANVPVRLDGDTDKLMSWKEALDLVQAGTHVNFSSEPIFGGKVPYIVPNRENPTAEVMSRLLYEKARELLDNNGLQVHAVRLYETPNCWADHEG